MRIPILAALFALLAFTAIASFLISFYPLLFTSIHISQSSADNDVRGVIKNAVTQVEITMQMCNRAFDALDSAGIQDYYKVPTPEFSQYWLLRGRLIGDLTMWLSFYEGTGVFVGRTVPCDKSIPRTPNVSVVWVTKLSVNHTFVAQQYLMAGINTSAIDGTQIGPLTTTFNATDTDWYRYLVLSIYAHWWVPAVDTFGENTSFFVGAQGGVDPNAYFCTYAAEVSAQAITDLLAAIPMSPQGRMMLFHPSNDALIGTNFQWESVVRLANGTLRPRTFRELGGYSPLLEDVVTRYGDALKSCSSPCSLDYGSQFDKVFVTVVDLSDAYYLHLRLVIVVPAIDFLAEIQKAHGDGVAISLPVLASLTVVFALVLWLTLKPLQDLEESMITGMLGEFQDTTRSIIAEIANIQEAYANLQAELKKVKSFLPQAVLKQLEGGDGSDDDSEGEICLGASALSDGSQERQNSICSTTLSEARETESTLDSSIVGERRLSLTMKRGSAVLVTVPSALGMSQSQIRPLPTTGKAQRKKAEALALSNRRVTIVAININGLHDVLKNKGVNAVVNVHNQWMSRIEEMAAKCRGVLEFFSGDHFTVSFNASSTCASHYSSAASLICQLQQLCDTHAITRGLSIGASSGVAYCGHMGTEKIKAFAIIGTVMTQAFACMRRCRRLDETSLVTLEASEGMKYEYVLIPSDVCIPPGREVPNVMFSVVEKKKAAADEWMYELQESEGKVSADKMMEDCMAAYMEGNQVLLAARIAQCEQMYPGLPQLSRLKQHSLVPLAQYAIKL